MGSHAIDAVAFVTGGDLEAGTGRARRVGPYPPHSTVEDVVQMAAAVRVGADGDAAPFTATWNFATRGPQEDLFVFSGTEAALSFSCFGRDPIVVSGPDGRAEHPFEPPAHVAQPFIQRVVDELLGRPQPAGLPPPSAGAAAAVRAAELMDSALAGFYAGRPALWPA